MMSEQGLNALKGELVMLKRYDIDGSKGASCWIITDEDEDNEDVFGNGIIAITMSYDMLEQTKARVKGGEFNMRTQVEVFYKTVMGGGNKPKLKAVSIRPLQLNKPVVNNKGSDSSKV
jgi:hypothetical protein